VVEVCHDCTTPVAEPHVESETAVVPMPEETPVQPETIIDPIQETPSIPAAPYPSANGTIPVVEPMPSGTGAPTESATDSAPVFEGAASAITATGAGILAIFGLVAAL